jgi:hypothetical protein
VPSLLIDGAGPLAAQVGVVAHNLDEALADVHRAKDEGYFAIKLYGSIDPAWVKPMADACAPARPACARPHPPRHAPAGRRARGL